MAEGEKGSKGSKAEANGTPRTPSEFTTFVTLKEGQVDLNDLPEGSRVWVELPGTQPGLTQDHAKKAAAQAIHAGAENQFKAAIQVEGSGVEITAVSHRIWQPLPVKVEPQPPKLQVG